MQCGWDGFKESESDDRCEPVSTMKGHPKHRPVELGVQGPCRCVQKYEAPIWESRSKAAKQGEIWDPGKYSTFDRSPLEQSILLGADASNCPWKSDITMEQGTAIAVMPTASTLQKFGNNKCVD